MASCNVRKVLTIILCLAVILFGDIWLHSRMAKRLALLVHLQGPRLQLHLFWDAVPYATGITSYNQGKSPYPLDDPTYLLPFSYPPVFVWVGGELARLLGPSRGWRLYIAIYLASLVALEFSLSLFFLQNVKKRQALALLCLAPLSAFTTTVFWSGNIHIIWYCAAVLAAISGLRHNRWLWYYLVAFLAAVNQPVFLLLVLLPLFAAQRQSLPSALTGAAAAAVYLVQRFACPDLYLQFRELAATHLLASRDFGQGAFGVSAKLLARVGILGTVVPAILQILFSCAILLALLRLRNRVPRGDKRWWALIAIAIVLANPRIMPYDAALGLAPTCYFLVFGLRTPWRWPLLAFLVAATCVAHRPIGFSLLLLAGFLVGARCLSGPCGEFEEPKLQNLRAFAA